MRRPISRITTRAIRRRLRSAPTRPVSLFDDSTRTAARVREAQGEASLHVWEGMPHAFPSNVGMLAAASEALDLMAELLVGASASLTGCARASSAHTFG